jgi:hypothetical protein
MGTPGVMIDVSSGLLMNRSANQGICMDSGVLEEEGNLASEEVFRVKK